MSDTIAQRIRRRRRELDFSQAELGAMADIGSNSISTYERGTIAPSIPTLRKLATALDVTTDWLVNG